MKQFLFFLLVALFTTNVSAQESRNMSQGSHEAFVIFLKDTNKKEVEEAWAKYIKDFKG